ncbi:MAG: hypothetical protein M3O15_04990 [Acidobacteriota bacterium]|nr:hypothetical protein [Acidobacteriota bacterium]
MNQPDSRTAGAASLRRRDFLALSSMLTLSGLAPFASLLESPAAAAPAPAAGAAKAPQKSPLSVGYLAGSEQLADLRRLPRDLRVLTVTRRGQTLTSERRVVPAHSLPSGDPGLVGGPVRMTIHDLYPGLLPQTAAARRWPVAIDLDVLVPLLDPPKGSTARFLAWSYRRLPAEDRSAGLSFVFWPDWYSDLSVILRVVPAGSAAQPLLLTGRFTLGSDPGRPRLLKGAYLLGLNPSTWEETGDLPDDPASLPPEVLSVLVTFEPEGLRLTQPRR